MDREYIGYFIAFGLILLGALVIAILYAEFRRNLRAKSDRAAYLAREEQASADREKAFQDKWGQ